MGRPSKEKQKISFDTSASVKSENNAPITEPKSDIDSELNKLNAEFNSEKIEAEKKTSKYYKEKKAREVEEKQFKEAMSGIGSSALSLILERMPNPKPLTDKESEQFDIVFDKLTNKYFSLLGKWQEESAFIIVLAFIIIPRTDLLNKKEIKNNSNEEKNN